MRKTSVQIDDKILNRAKRLYPAMSDSKIIRLGLLKLSMDAEPMEVSEFSDEELIPVLSLPASPAVYEPATARTGKILGLTKVRQCNSRAEMTIPLSALSKSGLAIGDTVALIRDAESLILIKRENVTVTLKDKQ